MKAQSGMQPVSTAAQQGVRRYRRYLFCIPMKLRYLDSEGIKLTHGVTLDISEGGVGAMVETRVPVGETVELEFLFADVSRCLVALVRHDQSGRSGFEFLGLTPGEREQIVYVARA